MGQLKFKQPINSPAFNLVIPKTSTAAIIKNRLVKYSSVGNVKHTTGTSGRHAQGVAITGCTAGGKGVAVGLFGVFTIVASTKAIAAGAPLRATSGAASTASFLGGTVRSSTVNNNLIGIALTSCAAAGTIRTVQVFVHPTINAVALS